MTSERIEISYLSLFHPDEATSMERCQSEKKNPVITKANGPLTRYVKLWVAHAPGISRTFSPPPTSKETAS